VDLGERTLGELQDAGILPGGQRKRRKNALRRSQHVLFSTGVDDSIAKERENRADYVSAATASASLEIATAGNSAPIELGWADSILESVPKTSCSENLGSSIEETRVSLMLIYYPKGR
jgi:hypothetical protein